MPCCTSCARDQRTWCRSRCRHTRTPITDPGPDLAALQALGEGSFPGLLGVEWLLATRGHTRARLPVRAELMAPNGFLHAGSVVGFADTACGYGCRISLPEGATGFTTIELKANFLGTLSDQGVMLAEAKLAHGGRSTQVWDATVSDEASGKTLALFRCTQMVLYAKR